MSITELLPLVEQYREAQQIIEQAQAEMEIIKEQIKAEMAARGTDRLDIGTHKVTVQTITTRRLDAKALQAELPDLTAHYIKTTTGTRFCVV